MIYLGQDPVGININCNNMKLIYTGIITQEYASTLDSLYKNEIKPHITYGDFHKLCICTFENNNFTGSNPINFIFFLLGVDVESASSNTRNGGMMQADYSSIRNFLLSNDARCSAGTILKIYTIDL